MKKNVVVRLLTLSMAAACAITNAPITNVSAAELTEVVADEVVVEEASAEDDVVVYNDADQVFAVGTDGVAYSNIGYLTNEEFASLDAETQATYISLCDNFGNSSNSSIAFGINEDGVLVSKTVFLPDDSNAELTPAVFTEDDLVTEDDSLVSDIDVELMENTFADNMYYTNNFFYNQLETQEEREIYKRVLAAAKKGKRVVAYPIQNHVIDGDLAPIYMCNAVNAAMAACPQYFEFIDYDAEAPVNLEIPHVGNRITGTVKISFAQSQYWSKDIEKITQDKVKSIVAKAYAAAEKSDPLNMQYEVVKYFDEWLSANSHVASFDKSDSTKAYYASRTSYGVFTDWEQPLSAEGYSKAMMRLLDAAGIKNTYVSGGVEVSGKNYKHHFNLVEMQDSLYYVVDTFLNDKEVDNDEQASSQEYLLTGSQDGLNRFFSYTTFTPVDKNGAVLKGIYPFAGSYDVSRNAYSKNGYIDEIHPVFTAKGKSVQLTMNDALDSKNVNVLYTANDPNYFTVSNKGKIKGKMVGQGDVKVTIGQENKTVPVFVYDFQSVISKESGKKSHTDTKFAKENFKYTFTVNGLNCTNKELDGLRYHVEDIYNYTPANLIIKSSKEDIAVIDYVEFTNDDEIIVYGHTNNKKGSTKITCNFGGKKATVKLKVNATK